MPVLRSIDQTPDGGLSHLGAGSSDPISDPAARFEEPVTERSCPEAVSSRMKALATIDTRRNSRHHPTCSIRGPLSRGPPFALTSQRFRLRDLRSRLLVRLLQGAISARAACYSPCGLHLPKVIASRSASVSPDTELPGLRTLRPWRRQPSSWPRSHPRSAVAQLALTTARQRGNGHVLSPLTPATRGDEPAQSLCSWRAMATAQTTRYADLQVVYESDGTRTRDSGVIRPDIKRRRGFVSLGE